MDKHNDLTVDGDLVRTLAALLEETGLSEIEYAQGDRRIRVVRNTPTAAVATALVAPPTTPPVPVEGTVTMENTGLIRSPMVGTAYLAPQPGAPHFVNVGDHIREGQPLLVIEAMKVMNQIHAPHAGRLKEILVANGTPVEFGQILMVLE